KAGAGKPNGTGQGNGEGFGVHEVICVGDVQENAGAVSSGGGSQHGVAGGGNFVGENEAVHVRRCRRINYAFHFIHGRDVQNIHLGCGKRAARVELGIDAHRAANRDTSRGGSAVAIGVVGGAGGIVLGTGGQGSGDRLSTDPGLDSDAAAAGVGGDGTNKIFNRVHGRRRNARASCGNRR